MRSFPVLLCALGVAACTTSTGATLDQLVRGPARICFDRSAFNLPAAGTIVEAERGSIGTHLTGRVGPHAFEITESGRFSAVPEAGQTVYTGSDFHVRRIGNLQGSYAVYQGVAENLQASPMVRIEHSFGMESVTIEEFFAGFSPEGAAQGGCGRTFR